MRTNSFLKHSLLALLALGVVCPSPQLFAGPEAASTAPASMISDITLSAAGGLTGRIVDAQGAPLEGATVVIAQGGKEVARSVADKTGAFTIAGLRNGVYQVQAGTAAATIRAWSPRVAPPSAKETLLLVTPAGNVRGQLGEATPFNVLMLGTAIGGLAVGIVALSELHDLQKDVDRIPKSP